MSKVGKYCTVIVDGNKEIRRVTLSNEEEEALLNEVINTNAKILMMCFEKAKVISESVGTDKESLALALFSKAGVQSFTLLQAALDEKVNMIKLNQR